MEFRWLALIALWTMLSGPIFASPGIRATSGTQPAVKAPLAATLKHSVKH
jgi:hypothetical protein